MPPAMKATGAYRFPPPPKSTRDLVNEAFGFDPSAEQSNVARTMQQAMLLMNNKQVQAQVNADPLAQAKKEGRVTWYTTISIPEAKQFIELFEKQYPFIKVDLLRSGAGALVNRILSEYAAKNYTPDVLQGMTSRGGLRALRQKEVLARYESPEYRFLPNDLKDKAGLWGSATLNTFVLVYNKRMVKADDVPKVYDDLLKPVWKGKQILNDSDNFEWFDGLLRYWGRDKALGYFRRLAQQEQVFQRGARGRIQLVAAGEFPVTIGYGPHAQSFISQGAPIDWVPLEPVVVILNTVSLASKAPHPAAARLFIDFLFSKTGQLKVRELNRIPARTDVDADPPRLLKGFKTIAQDLESEGMGDSIQQFQQIFGLRLK
jgi:iron(III) transport system substrate-binding protein